MKDSILVGKEFGDLADMRASDPVLISQRIKRNSFSKAKRQEALVNRGQTMKKIDENYFNKHFASTPNNRATADSHNALDVPEEFKATTRDR